MNILNEECSFPGLEKTQDYNGGVSQSSETNSAHWYRE